MTIETHQMRRLPYPGLGTVIVRATFKDEPATLETWVDNCGKLASEWGCPVIEIHEALFKIYPEVFGNG